ncbi:hypothetical protein L2E82_52474 [Cichorium intybus]|nr:hypothetical protein L2E82_52474 [Cichorium intybus]
MEHRFAVFNYVFRYNGSNPLLATPLMLRKKGEPKKKMKMTVLLVLKCDSRSDRIRYRSGVGTKLDLETVVDDRHRNQLHSSADLSQQTNKTFNTVYVCRIEKSFLLSMCEVKELRIQMQNTLILSACVLNLCVQCGYVMKFRRRSSVSCSLPEMSTTFRQSQTSSQQQRSQQSFCHGLSSQPNGIFSQFSQNSQDDTLTDDQQRCLMSEEFEHRIGTIESSLSRFGLIQESLQTDVMEVNKGTKELTMDKQEDVKSSLHGEVKSLSDQINHNKCHQSSQELSNFLSGLEEKIGVQWYTTLIRPKESRTRPSPTKGCQFLCQFSRNSPQESSSASEGPIRTPDTQGRNGSMELSKTLLLLLLIWVLGQRYSVTVKIMTVVVIRIKAVQRIGSKGSDGGGGDEGVCQSRGSRSAVLRCCTRKKQIGGSWLQKVDDGFQSQIRYGGDGG